MCPPKILNTTCRALVNVCIVPRAAHSHSLESVTCDHDNVGARASRYCVARSAVRHSVKLVICRLKTTYFNNSSIVVFAGRTCIIFFSSQSSNVKPCQRSHHHSTQQRRTRWRHEERSTNSLNTIIALLVADEKFSSRPHKIKHTRSLS